MLTVVIQLSANNDAEIHKYIFHNNILSNQSILKNSIAIINEEANLNQALTYFRVKYLNELYGNKNTNNETNGLKEYRIAKSEYFKERNSWLNSQLSKLKNNYFQHRFYSTAESFYEDLFFDGSIVDEEITTQVDTNQLHFYSMFFYSNKTINKYDSATDYYKILEQYLSGVKKEMEILEDLVLNESDLSGIDVQDRIEENIREIITLDLDIDLAKLILFKETDRYKTSRLNEYTIGFYKRNTFDTEKKDIKFTLGYSDEEIKIRDVEFREKFSIELNYKYLLKEEINFLSYVDFGLQYIIIDKAVSELINHENKYIRITHINSPRIKEFSFYTIYNINNTDISGEKFAFSIMAPIIALSPNIIIEFGLSGSYHSYSFSVSHTFDYERIRSYYNDSGYFESSEKLETLNNIQTNSEYTDNKFRILPAASFQFNNLFNLVELRVVTGWNVVETGLRIGF